MTNEEALKMLKRTCELIQVPCDCDKEQECVTQKARKALEKQKPKRPIIYYGSNVCPLCTTKTRQVVIMRWMHYCPDCGQKINFDEVEE